MSLGSHCANKHGEGLSAAEKAELLKEAESIGSKEALAKRLSERQEAALVAKRNAYLDTIKVEGVMAFIRNNFANDYAGGLMALIEGSLVATRGARQSVATAVEALRARTLSRFDTELSSAGLRKAFLSGEFDDDIMKALWHLNRTTPNQGAVKGLSKEAVSIAEIIIKHHEKLRGMHNKAGGHIPFLEGRITFRGHDSLKVAAVSKAQWVADVSESLDWEKTMPDVDISKRSQVLGEIYERISNDVQKTFQDGYAPGASIDAKGRLKKHRILHFKDVDGEIAYHKKYGSKTLADSVLGEMDSMARDTAIMERLGPRALRNLGQAVGKMEKELTAAGKGAEAKKFTDMANKIKETTLPAVTDEVYRPTNKTVAKWGSLGRSFIAAVDLGGSLLSQLADLVNQASTMRYVGAGGSQIPFAGVIKGLGNVLGNLRSITPEMRQIASELSIIVDGLAPTASKFEAEAGISGKTSRFIDKVYKAYGISGWQDRVRFLSVVTASHRYANKADVPWEKLDTEMKRYYSQHGIDGWEWDIMRQAKQSTDWKGRNLLTVDSLENLDIELFRGKGGDASQLKGALIDKYSSLLNEVGRLAATEPGAKVRGRMLANTRPGSLGGEGLRAFWQYKAAVNTILYEHTGRSLHGFHGERVSNYEAFKRMFTDPRGGGSHLAAQVVTGTMVGYLSMALKDLAKGRYPEQPQDWKQMTALMGKAMAQGGIGGPYGDFLFGHAREYYGEGPLAGVLGPTFGRFSDMGSLYLAAKNGDPLAPKALNLLLSNIPGKNFLVTRMATDHLIMLRFKEMLDPGYTRRLERRARERGQEFYLKPTETIPYGGGF